MLNDNQLPPNAKMVFKGKIFDVWQWEQKMFDGSTAIFEKLKRPDTVLVVAIMGDKILLLTQQQPNHPQPFPSLPGGRCDEGEEPLESAKRELLEETGYTSDDWTLWQEQNPVGKIIWTVYTYIARDCRQIQPPKLDAGEKISSRLINFDEFLALAANPQFYDQEIKTILTHACYDKKFKKELHNLLFKKYEKLNRLH